MMGLSKRSAESVVFMAYYPYISYKKEAANPFLTHPSFKETQTQFIAYLLRWCLQKDLVTRSKNGEYLLPRLDKNIASLSHILHVSNFQHLVYQDTLDAVMTMLSDNQSHVHTTSIQQLAISLLAIQEPEFIYYHINRTYHAFAAYALPDPDLTWADIHRQYPYMWVILTLHLVIKNFTELT